MRKAVETQDIEFKQFLFDTHVASQLKMSPLKSLELAEAESKRAIDAVVEKGRFDIKRGYELFKSKAALENGEQFKAIAEKILGESSESELGIDDYIFLDEMAKNELKASNFNEASCMFRFILQLNPWYGSAWVGWALCEQKQEPEVAYKIYELGLSIMPADYFICSYAADFFARKDKEKALKILYDALVILAKEGRQNGYSFQELNAQRFLIEGI